MNEWMLSFTFVEKTRSGGIRHREALHRTTTRPNEHWIPRSSSIVLWNIRTMRRICKGKCRWAEYSCDLYWGEIRRWSYGRELRHLRGKFSSWSEASSSTHDDDDVDDDVCWTLQLGEIFEECIEESVAKFKQTSPEAAAALAWIHEQHWIESTISHSMLMIWRIHFDNSSVTFSIGE